MMYIILSSSLHYYYFKFLNETDENNKNILQSKSILKYTWFYLLSTFYDTINVYFLMHILRIIGIHYSIIRKLQILFIMCSNVFIVY